MNKEKKPSYFLRGKHLLLLSCVAMLLYACKKEECLPQLPGRVVTVYYDTIIYTDTLLHSDTIMKPGEEDGMDVVVHSISPTSNTGNDYKLHAWLGTWSSVPGYLVGFIRFNYASLPAGADISSAKLTFYADTISLGIGFGPKGHQSLTISNEWEMRRVTSPWEESVVNFNTQPTTDDVGKITIPQSTSPSQAYTIDVTHFVKDEIAHPDLYHGFEFNIKNLIAGQHASISFFSSDAPYARLRPQLAISYDVMTKLPKTITLSKTVTLPNH